MASGRARHCAHGLGRVLIALAALLALAACKGVDAGRLAEGQPFPSLALPAADGQPVRIEALRGRMVVLNVWATWCPPCRREMPDLERLSKILDPQRFVVVGLSTDRDRWLAEEFLLRNNISFKNYFDADGSIARRLELVVYPETFIIAPDGVLMMRVPGLREWDSPEIIAELEEQWRSWESGNRPTIGGVK